jgi:hypothetical protein
MKNNDLNGKTKVKNQAPKLFRAFQKRPATMLMVAKETGIERANICRWIADRRETNGIRLVRFGLCEISKHRAGFYTTDFTQDHWGKK